MSRGTGAERFITAIEEANVGIFDIIIHYYLLESSGSSILDEHYGDELYRFVKLLTEFNDQKSINYCWTFLISVVGKRLILQSLGS